MPEATSKRAGKGGVGSDIGSPASCCQSARDLYEVTQILSDLRDTIGADDARMIRSFRRVFPNIGVHSFAFMGGDGVFVIGCGAYDETLSAKIASLFQDARQSLVNYGGNYDVRLLGREINIPYHEDGGGNVEHPCRALFIQRQIDGVRQMRCLLFIAKDRVSENMRSDSLYPIVATMLDEAMRQRCSIFHAFPYKLSEFYLRQAHIRGSHKPRLVPPWSRGGEKSGIETVTLSLDLRKSTLMMEKAVRPECFAKWLSAMVQVLRSIVHRHLGVFDKFTGDGVLAHFLVEDIDKVTAGRGPTAVRAAVCCADEMITAINLLLEVVQPFIRYDSGLFGAGVGIAQDFAHWTNDRSRHLIVVGTGVVDACRMSSGGKAGDILLTVNTLHQFQRDGSCSGLRAEKRAFTAKGYPEEQQLQAWALTRVHPLAPDSERWIEATCERALRQAFGEGKDDPCVGGWKNAWRERGDAALSAGLGGEGRSRPLCAAASGHGDDHGHRRGCGEAVGCA